MKKGIKMIAFLAALSLLLGMGSLKGSKPEDKIPVPAKHFDGTFVDQMDVVTECTQISIEGATLVEGKRGEGTYAISFDNIEQVTFRLNAERLTAAVKLRSGETQELVMNKNLRAFGRTTYGTYHIRLLNLRKIVISSSFKK